METAQMPFSDGGGPPAPMQTDLGVRGSGWANTSVQASSVPGSQVNERVPMNCDLVRMFRVGDVSLSYETNGLFLLGRRQGFLGYVLLAE